VGVDRPIHMPPVRRIHAVPSGAVDRVTGSRDRRGRPRLGEDAQRWRSGIENHSIDNLAERTNLHTKVLHGRLHLGFPGVEQAGRLLERREAVAQSFLHPVDAVLQRGLEVAHAGRHGLQLIENQLEIRIHRSQLLAGTCELLVIDRMRFQIGVSDTNLLAVAWGREGKSRRKNRNWRSDRQRTD